MSDATPHKDPTNGVPAFSDIQARARPEQAAGHRLFLVRHGQTSLNAAGLLRGRLDPELNVTGLIEAMAVAHLIGSAGLRAVVSSPLLRARDTAAQIAARAALTVETDGRLVDRDYGAWAGKAKEEVIAQWGSLDAAPGVEPTAEVFARSMDAFVDVSSRLRAGPAVLVTHDAVLQLLLPALDPALEQHEPIPQETGCFNVVEEQGDGWRVTQLNVRSVGPADASIGSGWEQ